MTAIRSLFNVKTAGITLFAGALIIAGCTTSSTPEPGTAPVIVSQPEDTTVSVGGSASFLVVATGAATYKWVRNDIDTLTGTTNGLLTLTNVALGDSGNTYKCVIGNANGTVVTRKAILSVSATVTPPAELSRQALIDTGIVIAENCFGCHGTLGNGQGRGAPPLANSDYVMGPKSRLIAIVLKGGMDSIRVNGIYYDGGGMPAWADTYTDVEIAGVLTYIRSVLNDSLHTSCVNKPSGVTDQTCTTVARDSAAMWNDTIPASTVKAVRDSLAALAP